MSRRTPRCGLGGLTPEERARLTEAVERYMATRCHAVSTVPLPVSAPSRTTLGQEFYQCGRDRGHDGLHRWPGEGTSPAIAEWS